jgi:protein-disulfide isomerase/uncharacterized membrane protein
MGENEMLSNKKLPLSLIFTFISICLHFYLSTQHYSLKFGQASGESLCNISDLFNCTAVAASSWSAIWGLPIANFGMVSNLILFIYLVIIYFGWTEDVKTTRAQAFALASVIALASVVMLFISVTQLKVYCLFCIATYVLSFLTFLGLYSKENKTALFSSETYTSFLTHQKWSLVMLALIPIGGFLYHQIAMKDAGFSKIELVISDKITAWSSGTANEFDESTGLIHQPTQAAKVTIVEFADFMCSHCKHAATTFDAFVKSHPDVKFIFKVFPLDGNCNSAIQGSAPGALRCASAGLMLCEQKNNQKGWLAQHWLFKNQEKLFTISSQEKLVELYVADNPTDINALNSCIDSVEIKDAIRAMANEGIKAGVKGTPSVFVNGKMLGSAQVLPVLEAVYDKIKN